MKRGLLLFSLFVATHCIGADTTSPLSIAKEKIAAPARALEAETIKSFQIQPGFRVELVAAEPLTANPIAMAFDEKGRLFVLEVPNHTAGGMNLGRVRVLEDGNEDGYFDGSSLYADNIVNPTALVCYGGGVFVAAGGEIIYLKDSKGDGVADQRRDVFKIFIESTNSAGAPASITGLAWGLDNCIHAVTSSRGGDIVSSTAPSQSLVLHEGSFAFDPRTFILKEENGSDASGLCFDAYGGKYICTAASPLQVVTYGVRYETQNPYYTLTKPVRNLSGSAGASLIYLPVPIGTPEPPPIRFTSAASLLMYDGNAFPHEYAGDAFVVDTAACVVHREKIRADGLVPTIERPGDEPSSEFFAVRDQSFQPTQIINAPDGALYFTGVTRGLQAGVKTNTAKTNPLARGRIFRIVPTTFKQPKLPAISKLPPAQLVAMLRHPNGWQRETASRLLYERQDRATVVPLIQTLFDPVPPPLARMRALRALDGIELIVNGRATHALLEPHLLHALNDPADHVREQAVLISEKFLSKSGVWSDALWGQLSEMGTDPSPRVRWQLALTLGQSHNANRSQTLADLIRTDLQIYPAVLSAVNEGASEVFAAVFPETRIRNDTNGVRFLRGVATIIGKKAGAAEILQAVAVLRNSADTQLVFAAANWIDQGLAQADKTLASTAGAAALKPLVARAAAIAQDLNSDDAARIDAMRFLAATSPVDFQLALVMARQWPVLKPALRSEFLKVFLLRSEWTGSLVAAMETGYIPRTDLTMYQVRYLLAFPNTELHARVEALFANWNGLQRQPVVNSQLVALQMTGSTARGHNVFLKNCAACHQTADEPEARYFIHSLADVKLLGKQKLLAAILDPKVSAESIHPVTLFTLATGEMLAGFTSAQNAKSILICDRQGAPHYIARSNILNQIRLDISGMPEDWEKTLNAQEMADLLEYLCQ